jgi:hypothetical protein
MVPPGGSKSRFSFKKFKSFNPFKALVETSYADYAAAIFLALSTACSMVPTM